MQKIFWSYPKKKKNQMLAKHSDSQLVGSGPLASRNDSFALVGINELGAIGQAVWLLCHFGNDIYFYFFVLKKNRMYNTVEHVGMPAFNRIFFSLQCSNWCCLMCFVCVISCCICNNRKRKLCNNLFGSNFNSTWESAFEI